MAPLFEQVKDDVPKDCEMVLIDKSDLQQEMWFFDKRQALQFKRSLRKNCPCQQRTDKCPFEVRRTVHKWFDKHGKNVPDWPFESKYPCHRKCTSFRHYHRTYESRQTFINKLKRIGVESVDDDSESDTAEDDSEEEEMEMSKELLEVSNYKQITTTTTSQSRPQNCIFSEEQIQNLERVPEEVPNDCNLVVITSGGSKLLKKDEVVDFKKKVLQNCPCQDELWSCPMQEETDVDVGTLFDCHSKTFKAWPFRIKYVCNEAHVGFRHYHGQESDRISCRLLSLSRFQSPIKVESSE